MFISTLLLFSTSLLNAKPAPIFADVRIGTEGTYRFLVDTGAETSLIDPKLAAALRLKPDFRLNVITQNSAQATPGTKVRNLSIGETALPETELLFYDVSEARRLDSKVRGVLGVNALAGIDFTLSLASGHLELTTERPEGEVVPFFPVEGRIGVKARMGSEVLTLILDSGATHMVLFHTPEAMAKTKSLASTFGTFDGARRTVPTTWTADMFFDGLRVPMLPAAIVERKGTQADGLLPASVFQKIHVDRSRGELVLVRRP